MDENVSKFQKITGQRSEIKASPADLAVIRRAAKTREKSQLIYLKKPTKITQITYR